MPPGPNVLAQAGARTAGETRGAPLFNDRFFSGLWTQRNILRDPSGVVQERWYGGRPDALLDGLNIELTNRLTLARAPGSTAFSTATLPQPANSFYSFRTSTGSSENIAIMADTASVLYSINPTSKTVVLTKAAGAGPAYMIGVNNTLYIGDGAEQLAWTGIGSVRNWGIAQPPGTGTSAFAYAGTGADAGSSWTNPTNIQGAPLGSYATATLVGNPFEVTSALQATNFGFSVSGNTIIQVVANVTAFISSLTGPYVFVGAQLIIGGAPIGAMTYQTLSSGTNVELTFTFTINLTDAQVNSSSFGVQFVGASGTYPPSHGGGSGTIHLEGGALTIFGIGATVGTPTGSGSLTTSNGGWRYVYEYVNANSGAYSPATPQGAATGNFTNAGSVTVPVVAGTDTQITGINVFRTMDGGSIFYSLPSNPYPNTTGNISDTNADSALNIEQLADLTGLNTKPPAGLTCFEFHLGRIWGAVGNTLYYSVGSDLGNILGNGYEGFPPANFFTFPSAIVKLRSISTITSAFLIVYTTSDIYVIAGNGSAATAQAGATGVVVFYAAPFLRRVGLASYFAEDVRGGMVYMYANDGRMISFNPTSQILYADPEKSIDEIGFPIGAPPPSTSISLTGGTLAGFTPASAYVTWHGSGSADQALYVSDGSTGWFRCNTNQQPDGGAVWSAKRNIVGGCSAVQSIETSPGMYQLLIGPPSGGGSVLYRDPTVWADNTTAYEAKARIGANILAHPGQTAAVQFITCDFAAVGSTPTVSVLFDELDATFTSLPASVNDPPQLTAPSSITSSRYYTMQAASGTPGPVACRFMQLWIDFGNTDKVQNELLTLTPFGSFEQEY